MSHSDKHRHLVMQVTEALQSRYPLMTFATDIQQRPGHPIPPLIAGFRPDVLGRTANGKHVVIAEAKTDDDLDNMHSWNQIAAFLNYLTHRPKALFVLAVSGRRAARGKTILRFLAQEVPASSAELEVFDSVDFWHLDAGFSIWHLR